VFVQHRKGKLDPEYFDAWELRTKAVMSVPRIQQFWSKTKTGYRRSFVEYIDSRSDHRWLVSSLRDVPGIAAVA
jgi:hypothetical protein